VSCQSLSTWQAWIVLLWSAWRFWLINPNPLKYLGDDLSLSMLTDSGSTLKPSISAIVENSIGQKDEGWAYRLSEATLQGFNLRLNTLHLSEHGASHHYKEATLRPSEGVF